MYLAVEECSTDDFVLLSTLIQESLFGVLFGSGEIVLLAATSSVSPLVAMIEGV